MVSTGRGGGGFHPPLANPPLQRLHGDRQCPRSIASGDELGSVGHRSSLDRTRHLKRRFELYSSIELNESFGSDRRSSMGELVYAVHATRPEDVGSVEVIFETNRPHGATRVTARRTIECLGFGDVVRPRTVRQPSSVGLVQGRSCSRRAGQRPGSLYPAEPWHGTALIPESVSQRCARRSLGRNTDQSQLPHDRITTAIERRVRTEDGSVEQAESLAIDPRSTRQRRRAWRGFSQWR